MTRRSDQMMDGSWHLAKPTSGNEPTPRGAPVKVHLVWYGIWLVATLKAILGGVSLEDEEIMDEAHSRALRAVGDAAGAELGDVKLLRNDAGLERRGDGRAQEGREDGSGELHVDRWCKLVL